MRLLRAASPFVAAILSSAIGLASSQLNIGPLARFDDIAVQGVVIGDPLALDRSRTTSLFEADLKAAEAFKVALLEKVAAHLRAGGLRVDPKSTNVVGFNVFGGKFADSGCDSTNFFLIEVWVADSQASRGSVERTILGVVDDAALPSALTDAAVSAIDNFVAQRKKFREAKH